MRTHVWVMAAVVVSTGAVGMGQRQAPGNDPSLPLTFRVRQIDAGGSETAALADLNGDGRLDIVSSDSWYQAPLWRKHSLRRVPVVSGYVDNFGDMPVDVNGDGAIDLVQVGYFAQQLTWLQNPGRADGEWVQHEIDSIGPTEFAFLVDLNNDEREATLLPQFTNRALPLSWYEIQNGGWIKREVAPGSYGHGIGAGDINGDGRSDILTPEGWLEAPADVRAPGHWTMHRTDWMRRVGAPHSGAHASIIATPLVAASVRVEFGFMHVIDLNGDGRNDVLTTMAHSFGVLWFEQLADGAWHQHVVDNTWSRGHASTLADLNGDGRLDFVTGTRFMGRNQAETEPLAIFWYEYQPGPTVTWTKHTLSHGEGRGAGLQIAVGDVNGNGTPDIVAPGKSGLFLFEQ
jgi:hypothetical protein